MAAKRYELNTTDPLRTTQWPTLTLASERPETTPCFAVKRYLSPWKLQLPANSYLGVAAANYSARLFQ